MLALNGDEKLDIKKELEVDKENREDDDKHQMSKLNPKYRQMKGEFMYKGFMWVNWASLDRIKQAETSFAYHRDDIMVATYPKTGTTLLQEMVWLVTSEVDIAGACAAKLTTRSPYLEHNYKVQFPGYPDKMYPMDYLQHVARPRVIKTHMSYRYWRQQIEMHPERRFIITLRNPKDTAVSYYHFYKGTIDYGPFAGDWSEFFEMWMDDWISAGDWLTVTREWWEQRWRKNLLFVYYEDMVTKPIDVVNSVSKFLGFSLSADQKRKLVDHVHIDNMRHNPMVNRESNYRFTSEFNFIRKGQIGDWRNWFTLSQNRRFDDKFAKPIEEMGLVFNYGGEF